MKSSPISAAAPPPTERIPRARSTIARTATSARGSARISSPRPSPRWGNSASGAEIVDGVLPEKKNDVQGVMVGAADFDWKDCGSTILPGAICEHFTSFGGEMRAGAGQTPLSEFLRYGAAGGQRHGHRTLRHREQVPQPDDPRPLRPRLLPGRGLLSVRQLPLPIAHRRRPALPALGRHPAGERRRRCRGGDAPRHRDTEARRPSFAAERRSIILNSSSMGCGRARAPRTARWRGTRRPRPTAGTRSASSPSSRARSVRKAGAILPLVTANHGRTIEAFACAARQGEARRIAHRQGESPRLQHARCPSRDAAGGRREQRIKGPSRLTPPSSAPARCGCK